ncbi:MAG: type II toxin-antitoxin system HipA family toxin [Paludibacteraceae bacterium]|nr:type II toxin-antitoxin system HipA family toxin [Paludibacteraceae bacterium]
MMMSHDDSVVVFQYDKQWLSDGFSISPVNLPLKPEVFVAPRSPFYGNFGIFEDSLPDGYGRYLLNRVLRAHGVNEFTLNPLQRLSIVGKSGMGALSYVPETHMGTPVSTPDLDRMQHLALEILSEKSSEDADVLYFHSGNSGGCRPKCLMHDRDGDWVVKFRHTYDPKDIGQTEFRYMQLAEHCGIDIPTIKLINGKYFASRRFDIDSKGRRLHVATAAALLSVSINPPMTDYKTLLQLTGYLTRSQHEVEQMFKRMVFNVLIGNKDDHAKNFSYICDEGQWRLAPAYDLLPFAEGYHGEHATSVLGQGNPTEEDMLKAGEWVKIARKKGTSIIHELKDKITSQP